MWIGIPIIHALDSVFCSSFLSASCAYPFIYNPFNDCEHTEMWGHKNKTTTIKLFIEHHLKFVASRQHICMHLFQTSSAFRFSSLKWKYTMPFVCLFVFVSRQRIILCVETIVGSR